MSLLKQREEELMELIETVLVRAETLRKCVGGGFSDISNCVRSLANATNDARLIAAKVDDLRDIEKYGPGGGR